MIYCPQVEKQIIENEKHISTEAVMTKYFADKNTVVKPEREPVMTKERFFKGDDSDKI